MYMSDGGIGVGGKGGGVLEWDEGLEDFLRMVVDDILCGK